MSNIIKLSEARERVLQEPINPIVRALDTLALALTEHSHVWTSEEVNLYETAISYLTDRPAGRRAPLPDREGMVERVKMALWEVCAAHSLEATNRGGARYAITGDVVEELARAAIRAINGGDP